MRKTKPEPSAWTRERFAWIAAGVFVIIGVWMLIASLRRPPQMGTDDEVFRTVDALYTAVRSRDPARLDKCAARLKGYHAKEKLSDQAARYLDNVIASARGGDWAGATQRLYDFMAAQRKEAG